MAFSLAGEHKNHVRAATIVQKPHYDPLPPPPQLPVMIALDPLYPANRFLSMIRKINMEVV